MYDIGDFVTWFIDVMLDYFKWFFNTLDNFIFNGTSLLRYSIFVVLIFPIILMLFTLISNKNLYDNVKSDIKNRKGVKDEKN